MGLTYNAFAFTFKEFRLATTRDSYLEQNKKIGQVSPIMRLITTKDGGLSSFCGKINENDFDNPSRKEILFIN